MIASSWMFLVAVSWEPYRHNIQERPFLPNMADRTALGALTGARSELFVAADALLVEGVGAFGNIVVLGFVWMAFAAGYHPLGFALFQVVMAVSARQGVTGRCGVGVVIEQHVAGGDLVHQSDGSFRTWSGKGRIAEYADHKQHDGSGKNRLPFLLCCHMIFESFPGSDGWRDGRKKTCPAYHNAMDLSSALFQCDASGFSRTLAAQFGFCR